MLTQSSSAAIAIVLTAASGGMIAILPAAAAVIGANLGTTSTAAVAVLKATPNARRLALGHIMFNLITGLVAMLLLPLMIQLVARLADGLELEGSPAAFLALFHTVFNLLGVMIMLPLTGKLTRFLEHRFTTEEELAGKPLHIDTTLAETPALAVAALRAELLRLEDMTLKTMGYALHNPAIPAKELEQQSAAIHSLVSAVAEFVGTVRTATMSREVGEHLARALRTARYLDEAARLSVNTFLLRRELTDTRNNFNLPVTAQLFDHVEQCRGLAAREREATADSDQERLLNLEKFEQIYQYAKEELLHAAVSRNISIEKVDSILSRLSTTRRMVEQLVKADRLLRSPALAEEIESEKRH